MEKVKLSNEIISSIARTYQYISRIDIQADYFEEINNRDTEHLKFTKSGKLSESNEKVCRQYVAEEYQEAFFKFVDLKTLPERMKNEETLVLEYRMKDGDWHRLRFVEKKRDENGVLTHVLCLIRSISDTIARAPYNKYGFTFVPQQTGRARKLNLDWVTFCYHPNVMGEEDFLELEGFLRVHEGEFVPYPKGQTKRREDIGDKLLRLGYFTMRHIRRKLNGK